MFEEQIKNKIFTMHEISSPIKNRQRVVYPLKAFDIQTISRDFDFSNINININESDVFIKEMNICFGLMKINALDHTSVDENTGRFIYSFWSARTLYFIVYCVIFLYCFAFNVMRDFGLSKRTTFDDSVLLYQFYIYSIVIILPFVTLLESRKMADYKNKWSLFQAKYTLIMGKILHIRVKRLSVKIIITILISSLFGTAYAISKFFYLSPYATWEIGLIMTFNIYSVILLGLLYGYWCLVMTALKQVSATLNADIKGFEHKHPKIQLSSYEELWLDFSRLIKASGSSACYTMSVIIIFIFLMLTLSAYSTIATINEQGTCSVDLLGMASITICSFTLLIIFGNVAEGAVKSAGEDYQNILLDLKSTMLTDDTKKSLDRFLHVIASTSPVVDLGGFVVVNKSLNTSLLSSLVTYLIVLLQFRFTSSAKQA